MILARLSRLKSSSDRKKLFNVLMDRGFIAFAGVKNMLQQGRDSLSSKVDKSTSDRVDADSREICIGDDPIYKWDQDSSFKIDARIYDSRMSDYRQDVYKDGFCSAEFTYDVQMNRNAFLYTDEVFHRSAFDSKKKRIGFASYSKSGLSPPSYLPFNKKRFVKGVSANLYGNVAMAGGNYGHWLLDGLARLFLIDRFYDRSTIDYFIVPPRRYPFHQEMLDGLGIPDSKVIELEPLQCLQFEQLINSSAPRGYASAVIPRWITRGYRESLLSESDERDFKKIFVSRRDSAIRQMGNEDELATALEAIGFQTVVLSEYNFMEKVKLFQNADVVVGMSGAGMTNLMFCPSHAKVFEIFAPSLVNYNFASICLQSGIEYRFYMIEASNDATGSNNYYGQYDINISDVLPKIESLLDKSS